MRPVLLVCLVALGACTATTAPTSEGAYCTEVGNRLTDLNATGFIDEADLVRVLDSWRAVAAAAPLAVETEWGEVLRGMETVITVDPADAESVQAAADTLRSIEPAADRVISYTFRLCNALIGPQVPVSTTPSVSP